MIRQAYLEIALLYLDSASQRLKVINELQQAERDEPKATANIPSPEKKKKSRVSLDSASAIFIFKYITNHLSKVCKQVVKVFLTNFVKNIFNFINHATLDP